MRIRFAKLLAVFVFGSSGLYNPSPTAASHRAQARFGCPAAQAALFRWWAGIWDYAIPGYDPGVTTVTPSEDGCQLQEEFVDVGNKQAHTTILFDPGSQRWKRLVADPFRTYRSSGVFAPDGSIAFYETPTERETYRPVDHDHVHFLGESSTDGGKSWKIGFDAIFTRRP
ncbi:MAG: hypothetical protein ABJC74_09080 [Gemmatimonadota bacterium]